MVAPGRLIGLILSAGLCVAAGWSVRLAWADWLGRVGSVEAVCRASALAPGNAGLRARLSDWQGAVSRNPYDSASLIRLGLEAEGRGDFTAAERELLRAAKVDRLYEPRWALANYYFRRQAWNPFWQWANESAGVSPVAPTALYRLCGEASPDAGQIFDRVVAGRQRLLEGFLYWVESRNDLAGLRAVVPRSVEIAGPGERDALVRATSRILWLDASADALRSWNRLVERGLLPFGKLDPRAGVSLTNGDFRLKPQGETFNWLLIGGPGVTSRWEANGGIRWEFSGDQPERCDLLAQNVPVIGGRRYVLRCRYRTSGIASGAGPLWLASDSVVGQTSAAGDWTETAMEFAAPPAAQVIRLMLAYRRVPGTVRIEGTFWLRNVGLETREAANPESGRASRRR